MAPIHKLTIRIGRIDLMPEDIEQLIVGHEFRVIGDLYHFGVTTPAIIFIRRIFSGAAGITGYHRNHPSECFKRAGHAPEAAACEHGFFCHASGCCRGFGLFGSSRKTHDQQQRR